MTSVIGTAILATVLIILSAGMVILYISLIPPKPAPRPHRKIQRTIYGRDWNRIMEMTKIEKGAKRK